MGRHRKQTAALSEDEPSEGTRLLPLRDVMRERRKAVLGTAAGVVSVLALGGVVTLARGFAGGEADGCAPDCATEQQADDPGVAEPGPTASRRPTATPTGREAGRTFGPTVVRQEKRAEPRPTPTGHIPSPSTHEPEPPWHGHWPPRHGHHFW